MTLCGITHEAPGSWHMPATRGQMASKQANYFNTKLWCPALTLWGHFGTLLLSLQLCRGRCLPWSYKDVKWVIIVTDRPQYSTWCPDVEMVICSVFWWDKGSGAGATSLPLELIGVDARLLESRVDNSLSVQVFYWYLKMSSQCI